MRYRNELAEKPKRKCLGKVEIWFYSVFEIESGKSGTANEEHPEDVL